MDKICTQLPAQEAVAECLRSGCRVAPLPSLPLTPLPLLLPLVLPLVVPLLFSVVHVGHVDAVLNVGS